MELGKQQQQRCHVKNPPPPKPLLRSLSFQLTAHFTYQCEARLKRQKERVLQVPLRTQKEEETKTSLSEGEE